MAFLTRITVHIFYRIMGLAMHICKVLSSVQVDPKSFRRITSAHVHGTKKVYRVSAHATQRGNRGALVDRGANGGIIGNDAHVLYTHPGQEVDVTGIDNHQIDSLRVVDASAKIFTQRGEAIGIFRQYARNNLPLRSSDFQYYEFTVLLYSLLCGSTWALYNDRSLRSPQVLSMRHALDLYWS